MKEVPLTQGYVALIDDDDYERVMEYKWSVGVSKRATSGNGGPYVMALIHLNKKTVYMHRLIMGLEYGDKRVIDHADHNPLNNQKSNLEIKTHQENVRRQKINIKNTSGFKGVVLHKKKNRYFARITVDNSLLYLGSFIVKEDAARAYNTAALKYFGENAVLNVIEDMEPDIAASTGT